MPAHLQHRQSQLGRRAAIVPATELRQAAAAGRLARLWLVGLLVALALALSACGRQPLYTDLAERDANELIAALQVANIEASKVDQGKQSWTVEVAQGDFARAVNVLRNAGLPRPKFDTLGSVFKKGGFGDNATDAHARYVHARQQELTNALHKIDGVLDASVELSIPPKDRLMGESVPPTASVLVKYRPGSNLQSRSADLKALVANGVEGLTYDRVNVVMFRAEDAVTGVAVEPATDWTQWLLLGLAFVLAGIGIAGVLRRRAAGVRGGMLVERGR